MSWLFSRALVEEYSAGTSLAGEPCAQLNVMPTPQLFWRRDKTIDCSSLSRFGQTLQPLTDGHGAELLMSYLAAFRARTSAPPDAVLGLMANEAASGHTWQGSLAKYSPDSRSWKTAQFSLLADSELFSETWPRWGSMRNGELFLRTIPALPTCASESGLLPTPNVPNGGRSVKHITDWRGKSAYHNGKKVQVGLESVLGGAPHPTFLEWQMGWPIGWTAIEPLAMDKFHAWQRQHGRS
jgi:hypothetical protein